MRLRKGKKWYWSQERFKHAQLTQFLMARVVKNNRILGLLYIVHYIIEYIFQINAQYQRQFVTFIIDKRNFKILGNMKLNFVPTP